MRRRGAERRMPQGCGPSWGIRNDIALWLRDTRSGAQCSTSRASVFTRGGLTRERGRVATVAGRAALMDTSVPEVICLRSFLMPPQALPTLPRVCERLIGGAALRSVPIVLLPWLVLAAEASPVPTGYDLFKLLVGEFRAYVAGIVEGLANAVGRGPERAAGRLRRSDVFSFRNSAGSLSGYLAESVKLISISGEVFTLVAGARFVFAGHHSRFSAHLTTASAMAMAS